MGIPVRLSEELTTLAKEAAEAATRSLTAQVEHWALIGRAVERALDHASLTALKASSGKLSSTVPDVAKRAAITAAIREAVEGMDRDALRRRIASGKAPLHGIDRLKPEAILRYTVALPASALTVQEKTPRYAAAKRRKRA